MPLSVLPALTIAAAGAARRLGLLTRPGPLAAMVRGMAAALLAAFGLACTAEPNSTYPPPLSRQSWQFRQRQRLRHPRQRPQSL